MFANVLKSRIWSALNQFIATTFIYLGLVLLAWGMNEISGYVANPVRMSFAVVVIVQASVNSWLVYQTPPHAGHEHHFDLGHHQPH